MTGRSNLHGGTADLFTSAGEPAAPDGDQAPPEVQDQPRPAPTDAHESDVPLLASNETQLFQSRWEECLRGFVDEPRTSVQQADELVADVIRELANVFAEERSRLEEQWARGDEVSTEDLRLALQRYRSFFQRLLRVGS
jgi:hypothetical protein